MSRATLGSAADPCPENHPGERVAPMTTSRAVVVVRQSAGKRGAILLIHSEGGGGREFDELFVSPLALERRLIAINLPGHGGSSCADDPETANTVEGYADTALEVLERLGVDRALVIDRWKGGAIGRELMTIFSGMIALAVVVGPSDGADCDLSSDIAPVFAIPDLSADSLEPLLKCADLAEIAMSTAGGR